MAGPVYIEENRSGVIQIKLDIISSNQNSSLDSEEFATIQFLDRDFDIAPRDVITDLQSALGAFLVSSPRKAYIKISTKAVERV
jgi:hypothetical protein